MDVSDSQPPANESMSSSRASRTPKLKDSCDTCAASKIRCNKRKPVCGRCAKQGYSCVYSPARRIGRRRSAKAAVSDSNDTSALSIPSPVLTQQNQNLNAILTPSTLGENHSNSQNIPNPPLPTLNPYPSSQSSELSKYHAAYLLTPPSSSDLSDSSKTSQVPSPIHHLTTSSQSDCTTLAIDTLLQLELAQIKLKQRNVQNIDPYSPIETVTAAFRTLSAVLICTCSESPEVGLLAAAVSLSMLDVYGAMLSDSTGQPTEQTVHPMEIMTPDSLCILMPIGDEFSLDVSPKNNSASSANDDSREDVTLRVLGELSKIARVVSQFTMRYGDGNEERKSPDFLKALANLLRSKLQSVTAQATE